MHEEHDLEELEEASGRNARDAADLDAATAEALLETPDRSGDDEAWRSATGGTDPGRAPEG